MRMKRTNSEGFVCTDLGLNIVELLALSLHQYCHIKENLVQFEQVLLNFLHSIMSLLDLTNGLKDLTTPLLMNCHLEEILALTSLNDLLYGVFIWLFSCDSEVPEIVAHSEIRRLEKNLLQLVGYIRKRGKYSHNLKDPETSSRRKGLQQQVNNKFIK